MGVLNGGGNRRRGQFWGEFGTSRCCVVVRERRVLPKLLRGGVVPHGNIYADKPTTTIGVVSVFYYCFISHIDLSIV